MKPSRASSPPSRRRGGVSPRAGGLATGGDPEPRPADALSVRLPAGLRIDPPAAVVLDELGGAADPLDADRRAVALHLHARDLGVAELAQLRAVAGAQRGVHRRLARARAQT